jgi:hypothetical protein
MTPHELAHEMERVYGEDLKAVVLYGSAVGTDYSKRFSDFNVFCVLREVTPAALAKSSGVLRRWMKRGNPAPHFFDPAYIDRSLDVFPLEFLDMKDRHETLVGRDPLEGIEVDRKNLRHQCESEFKGKLIHLRTYYAANCGKPKMLARMMVEAFPTFLAAMRGVLWLLGERAPADARAVVELVGNRVDINPTIFYDIIEIRRGESLLPRGEEAASAFERYLTEIEALTRFVDELQV